ncbi:WD40 repeat-like protein, partial [Coemansia sp. RSA 2708]
EYYAPVPATTRGQPVRLSTDPEGTQLVYASGKSIVVRSLAAPEKAWEYTGHTAATTVARFSPSGAYVASGDASGKVRVWGAGGDHILKGEFQPLAGSIADIAWDGESQRVFAVGAGKGFGHFFTYDTGNAVGTAMGHSKVVNACAMRQRRPLRAVTASDDATSVFYHGAPYKLAATLKRDGFVQDVRYAPSDEWFVAVGADRKVLLYDGTTGELVRQVAAGAEQHAGSVYAVAWSPDSRYVVTAGGDGTCRFWDVQQDCAAGVVRLGAGPEHQQVGCVWAGEHIVSLSLSGALNYLQMGSDAPVRVVSGHQKPITAAALSGARLLTASYDGRVCAWDTGAPCTPRVVGTAAASVDAMAAGADACAALGTNDGGLQLVAGDSLQPATALGTAPRALAYAADGALVAVLHDGGVAVVRQGRATRLDLQGASAVAACGRVVALGFADASVRLYALADGAAQLEPTGAAVAGHMREITALALSADAQLVASGDGAGKIVLARAATGDVVTTRWGAHTARVYSVRFSADAQHAVSAALDGSVIVWSVARPLQRTVIRNAHLGGAHAAFLLPGGVVASAGADAAVKLWGKYRLATTHRTHTLAPSAPITRRNRGSRSPRRYHAMSCASIAASSIAVTPSSACRASPARTLCTSAAASVALAVPSTAVVANRSASISRRLTPPNRGSSMGV